MLYRIYVGYIAHLEIHNKPKVPDTSAAITTTREHPFSFFMEAHRGHILRDSVVTHQGVGVVGVQIVQADVLVSWCDQHARALSNTTIWYYILLSILVHRGLNKSYESSQTIFMSRSQYISYELIYRSLIMLISQYLYHDIFLLCISRK